MTGFKCRTPGFLAAFFIVLLSIVLGALLQSRAHAGEMADWVGTLRPYISALEQKIALLPNGPAKSAVESRYAALRSSTSRLEQLAASVDAYDAREASLRIEIDTKKAALAHVADIRKQAMADIDRRLDEWGRERDIHNASEPGPDDPQSAHDAYQARADEGNARRDALQTEKQQLQDKLAAEHKPVTDAYMAAMLAAGALAEEKQKASQPLHDEFKTWSDQRVWLDAAADVAASGTDPESALMPFPSGGVSAGGAGLAARDTIPAGTNLEAGAQLKSAEAHSQRAGTSGDKEEAGNAFDTSGRENGSLVIVKEPAGRPAPAFVAKLPDAARNDAQIQQSTAYYQQLDVLKAETAQKIQQVKAEQEAGKGDAAVLAAHLGTLTNDLKRSETDQAQAKETLKKRVKDLGFDWNE